MYAEDRSVSFTSSELTLVDSMRESLDLASYESDLLVFVRVRIDFE